MKALILPLLAAAALLTGAASVAGPRAEVGTLTLDLGREGASVSPGLYGLFFEEINHAGDGGLYGELVRNRSFEDAEQPEGWSVIREGGARGKVELTSDRPLNGAQKRALRIACEGGEGRLGAAASGYWGIPVRKGEEYRLSFFAHAARETDVPLVATLEGAGGKVYASARFSGLTPEWRRYSAVLRASETDPAARLVLSLAGAATVTADVVSLFPRHTWKERPNGLRPDLGRLLGEMKPAFLRFPGGCYCEGDRLANAFRWKDSLGDISERPGHWNLWGYRSTDGLGYHEYLQLCEDLGATPLFVVNCGMSHTDLVPLDRLDPWVQDAVDAVEYANGPVTSKWGALRARAGHPEPFNLRYLEIGNENGWGNTLPRYEERYARFYDALKKRFPDVKLVANVPVRSRPMDLVDDHYYNSPEWFLANVGKYDHYDRKGPKVYVGEYAVTQKCGQGNLRAALAEAAFMMGLERNSDVVHMASYAPLFVNVRDRKWNPDAIVFDNVASFGTPSYHVQKLFAQYRPDRLVPLELEAGGDGSPAAGPSGGIGLGTWSTQAEFRNITVSRPGQAPVKWDFSRGIGSWKALRGDWKAVDGAYRQGELSTDRMALAGDLGWTDYTLELDARKLGGAEGFLIMFHAPDERNFFWWNLGGWNNQFHAMEHSVDGSKSIITEQLPGRIETGRWYHVKIELQGTQIRCYLDGKLVQRADVRGPSPLHALAGRRGDELIVKVVNAGPEAQTLAVRTESGTVSAPATAVVLAGDPDDENSFSQPTRVAPATRDLGRISLPLRHTFPPHSLTILRLKGAGLAGRPLPAGQGTARR